MASSRWEMRATGFVVREEPGSQGVLSCADAAKAKQELVMKFVETLARMVRNSDRSTELLGEIVTATTDQQRFVNDKLDDERPNKLIEALDNQSRAANERLDKLIEALDNQSCAANERLDKLIEALNDQSHAVNERLNKLIEGWDNQSQAVNVRLDKLIQRAQVQVPTGWVRS
jgi:hypothetical protein